MARLHRPARLLATAVSQRLLLSPPPSLPLPNPHFLQSPRYFSWWNPSSKPPDYPPQQTNDVPPPPPPPPHHDQLRPNDVPGDVSHASNVGDSLLNSAQEVGDRRTTNFAPLPPNQGKLWTNDVPDDVSHADDGSTLGDCLVNSAPGVGDGFGDAVAATVANSLKSPIDLVIAFLDSLHDVTGFPWWVTISLSAVLMRGLLVPLVIMQLKNVAQIKLLAPKLQLEMLVKGLHEKNFIEQYRLFKKRKLDLGCPSLAWLIGPGFLVQVPLMLTIVFSLRRMAFEQHSGFIVGGALWFKDLTLSGNGSAGAVLPLVIAMAYLANVQVSFQGIPVRQDLFGMLMKGWRKLLQFSTILIFITMYHCPQAIHMLSVPHSIMTLSQNVLLRQQNFVRLLIGSEAGKMLHSPVPPSINATGDLKRYNKFLKDAGTCFSSRKFSEAIHLLEEAIKEEPEKEEAYALSGWVYRQNKDWVKSDIFYKHAIAKGKTDEFKIAAYSGSGLALLRQGKILECITMLRAIRNFEVPTNPDARYSYYCSMFILSRTLRDAGMKDESEEIMQEVRESGLLGISKKESCSRKV